MGEPARKPASGAGDETATAGATPVGAPLRTDPGGARSVEAEGVRLRPFEDPDRTAAGEPRARVDLRELETLWFNTGTLCNLACANCYIESSPRNDRLAFLTVQDVRRYLDEIERDGWGTRRIGFTGGEPFVNPQMLGMLEESLSRGFDTLVLTNAMRPMMLKADGLERLGERHGDRLHLRVSLDHYTRELHEEERGPKSWKPAVEGLAWLSERGFDLSVAGRTCWGEPIGSLREGFATLFRKLGVGIDASDPARLVLFPEMDEEAVVPEITTGCWDVLDTSPDDVMCSDSRMVVRRRGAESTVVLSCTLLPYQEGFEMGETLAEAAAPVKLNHPYCAAFCVLGGASCSPD